MNYFGLLFVLRSIKSKMMKENIYAGMLESARKFVVGHKYNSALNLLRQIAVKSGFADISDEVNRIGSTYEYLLQYFLTGAQDSGRNEMLALISESIMSAIDTIDYELKKIDEYSLYANESRAADRKRSFKNISDELLSALSTLELTGSFSEEKATLLEKAEKLQKDLFTYLWVNFRLNSDDRKSLESLLREELFPEHVKLHLLSALMLSLMHYFDPVKIVLLLDVFLISRSMSMRVRSGAAIVFALAKYAGRATSVKEIALRLESLRDVEMSDTIFKDIVFNIIRAKDTERINNKVRNEFIPDLQKLQSEIKKRFNRPAEEIDMSSLDLNPEWEDFLNRSGLSDKMMELQELQSSGADVMMFAFSNLKGFPFFREIPNWFLPFYRGHSLMTDNLSSIVDSLLLSDIQICDSDRYSFVLSFSSLPENNKKMLVSQLDAQISQLKEERPELASDEVRSSKSEATRYIRDLYRFYKLFSRKNEFYDPFAHDIGFLDLPVVGDLLSTGENIKLLGEFYFNNGYYKEAASYFQRCEKNNDDSAIIYQKLGYAFQVDGDWEKALGYYHKAELFSENDKWLYDKIAFVCRHRGDFPEAIKYYSLASGLDPENVRILTNLASAYIESGQIEEALKYLFKASYLDEKNEHIIRLIAWCLFLKGNLEKSLQYYSKISKESFNGNDYLNLGHLNMAKSDFKSAAECYSKAIEKMEGGKKEFEEMFDKDAAILSQQGIDKCSVRLILDYVCPTD